MLKLVLFLLDDAAALVLLILVLHFLEIEIPITVVIILALLAGTFIFILHKAVIPDFRRRPITGQEGMIGLEGRVIKPLTPAGTIAVCGENWKARSVNGNAGMDEAVEIVGVDRLMLTVRRKEH